MRTPRLLFATVLVGVALAGVLALMLARFRRELHEEIRRTVIGRDAAVLLPVARQQIAAAEARGAAQLRTEELLAAVLPASQQDGMLAVAVFDSRGELVRALPQTLLFAELSAPDYIELLAGTPISRYQPEFQLDRYFSGFAAGATAPVLEVLLPLEGRTPGRHAGFAQYYIDARSLGRELAAIEARLNRQTMATISLGTVLFAAVLAGAYWGLRRAQRLLAERNERLARANFELTLSAKTSALGQITSHLIHGLQGSVAGLRAAMDDGTANGGDWRGAAQYTERMQSLISEVVGLLGDAGAGVTYELNGDDLASIIREKNSSAAAGKGLRFAVDCRMSGTIDSHRGGLLCLIAANLVQNAIASTPPGGCINAVLSDRGPRVTLTVSDDGAGIPDAVLPRLFEPGATSRPGGSGLGLAISRLLARQVDGDIELLATGPDGTRFLASLPRAA